MKHLTVWLDGKCLLQTPMKKSGKILVRVGSLNVCNALLILKDTPEVRRKK